MRNSINRGLNREINRRFAHKNDSLCEKINAHSEIVMLFAVLRFDKIETQISDMAAARIKTRAKEEL